MEQVLRDAVYFLMPPDILLIAIAGLLPFCRRARPRRWLIGLVGIVIVMAMPVTSWLAIQPLQPELPVPETVAEKPDVLVVLGAGAYNDGQGGFWLGSEAAFRAAAGIAAVRKFDLPMIYSGGTPYSDEPPEADVAAMRLDLPPGAILETESINTLENARNTAEIMRRNNWRSILLVTSERHLRRAAALFRAQGVEVAAAIGVNVWRPLKPADFLPRAGGLNSWRHVLKEYIGIAWYLLTGEIGFGDLSPK